VARALGCEQAARSTWCLDAGWSQAGHAISRVLPAVGQRAAVEMPMRSCSRRRRCKAVPAVTSSTATVIAVVSSMRTARPGWSATALTSNTPKSRIIQATAVARPIAGSGCGGR
jgi:hypothetical protein